MGGLLATIAPPPDHHAYSRVAVLHIPMLHSTRPILTGAPLHHHRRNQLGMNTLHFLWLGLHGVVYCLPRESGNLHCPGPCAIGVAPLHRDWACTMPKGKRHHHVLVPLVRITPATVDPFHVSQGQVLSPSIMFTLDSLMPLGNS